MALTALRPRPQKPDIRDTFLSHPALRPMVEKSAIMRSRLGRLRLGRGPAGRLVARLARVLLGLLLMPVPPAAALPRGGSRQGPTAERRAEAERGEDALRPGDAVSREIDGGG